jgi:Flp pilus assembly pilin Flp
VEGNPSAAAPAQSIRDERGQGLVEYALIIALVSVAAVGSLGFLSGKINELYMKAGNSLASTEVAAVGGGATESTDGDGGGGGGGDTVAPALLVATPTEGATGVDTNPTYTGTCGTADGDQSVITINVVRVAGNPDSGSPYGPFTAICSSAGTWDLTHPGPGASQGLKRRRRLFIPTG